MYDLDYGFTANLEAELDEISNGALDWVAVMEEFWATFAGNLRNKENISRGIPVPAAEPRVRSWDAYSRRFLDPAWHETQTPELCPKCRSVVLLQNSSRGLFVQGLFIPPPANFSPVPIGWLNCTLVSRF